jgi:hypothetical protein
MGFLFTYAQPGDTDVGEDWTFWCLYSFRRSIESSSYFHLRQGGRDLLARSITRAFTGYESGHGPVAFGRRPETAGPTGWPRQALLIMHRRPAVPPPARSYGGDLVARQER